MPRRPRVDASMQSLPLDVAGDAALRAVIACSALTMMLRNACWRSESPRIRGTRGSRRRTTEIRVRGTRAIAGRARQRGIGADLPAAGVARAGGTSRRLTILAARFASR